MEWTQTLKPGRSATLEVPRLLAQVSAHFKRCGIDIKRQLTAALNRYPSSVCRSLSIPAVFRQYNELSSYGLIAVNATAIALLGPGGFSLDARLFGRRTIFQL